MTIKSNEVEAVVTPAAPAATKVRKPRRTKEQIAADKKAADAAKAAKKKATADAAEKKKAEKKAEADKVEADKKAETVKAKVNKAGKGTQVATSAPAELLLSEGKLEEVVNEIRGLAGEFDKVSKKYKIAMGDKLVILCSQAEKGTVRALYAELGIDPQAAQTMQRVSKFIANSKAGEISDDLGYVALTKLASSTLHPTVRLEILANPKISVSRIKDSIKKATQREEEEEAKAEEEARKGREKIEGKDPVVAQVPKPTQDPVQEEIEAKEGVDPYKDFKIKAATVLMILEDPEQVEKLKHDKADIFAVSPVSESSGQSGNTPVTLEHKPEVKEEIQGDLNLDNNNGATVGEGGSIPATTMTITVDKLTSAEDTLKQIEDAIKSNKAGSIDSLKKELLALLSAQSSSTTH